jgi:transcription factor IIIB subunit 2
MDRDWMTTGRRPAGLCGASILIASRYHGFRRSIKEITHVVRVCDETIRRRLEEFSKTSTARLTVNQFEANEDILDDGKGRDPPAFIKNRLKEKELNNQELVIKAKEIERIFKYEVSNKETLTCSNENNVNENSIIIESFQKSQAPVKTSLIDGEMKTHLLSDDSINFSIPFKSEDDKIIPSQKSLNKENKIINSKEEEELSDIEIEESSLYIVSNQEYKLKKLLWEVLFKDWIEEQKDKKKAEKKEVKKRERKFSKPDTKGLNDPVDAIVNSNKFKKMNVNFLNTMFNKN